MLVRRSQGLSRTPDDCAVVERVEPESRSRRGQRVRSVAPVGGTGAVPQRIARPRLAHCGAGTLARWHAGTLGGSTAAARAGCALGLCLLRSGRWQAVALAVAALLAVGVGGLVCLVGLVWSSVGLVRRGGRGEGWGEWCGARGHAGTLVCTQAMGNRNKQHGERTAGSYLSRTCRLARRGSPPPAYTICAALRRVAGGLRAIRIL